MVDWEYWYRKGEIKEGKGIPEHVGVARIPSIVFVLQLSDAVDEGENTSQTSADHDIR